MPISLTQILPHPGGPLYYLVFGGAGENLCAPLDPVFQDWLDGINTVVGPDCQGLHFVEGIADQVYVAGQAVSVEFPEAASAVPPITYTLVPDPPSGLTFDASMRTLSGTPNVTTPQATYTYAAMDSVAQKDSLQFTIEVMSGLGAERGELPTAFTLQGNFPNPFQQSTRIEFDLPWRASVSVEVLDVLGRRVLSVPARDFPAGWKRGIDLSAAAIPSGTYLYRLRLDGPTGAVVRPGSFVRIK